MSMLATFVALRITLVRWSRSELVTTAAYIDKYCVAGSEWSVRITRLHMTKTNPSVTKSSTQSTSYLMTEMEWGPVL